MKTDKIMKQVCVGLLAVGGLIVTATVTSYTGIAATVNIPVTITNTRPTCGLKLDGKDTLNYELGTMKPGTKMVHPVFTASVECQGSSSVKTAITATLASGGTVQNSGEDIRLDVGGVSAMSNTPLLWLQTETGGKIKLTGLETDAFCVKADTTQAQPNVCKLYPVTDIPPQSPLGDFTASVQLTIAYPQ